MWCYIKPEVDLSQKLFCNFFNILGTYSSYDRAIALQRLQSAGAVLTTTESAIFEMIQTAEFDKFKVISKLLKESNIDNSNNEKFDNIKW